MDQFREEGPLAQKHSGKVDEACECFGGFGRSQFQCQTATSNEKSVDISSEDIAFAYRCFTLDISFHKIRYP